MDQTEFATAIVKPFNPAVPVQTVVAVMAWMEAEGGNWHNTATCNPLNTCLVMGVSRPMNSVGVQAYPDWPTGVAATLATLNQPNMAPIADALRAGTDCAGLSAAVAAAPWGTGSFIRLCDPQSLPVPAPAPGPAQPSTSTSDVVLPTLTLWTDGGAVRLLQLALNDRAGARLVVDGVYGPVTIGAVRAWQTFWHLPVDGIVGPATWLTVIAFG